MSNAPKPGAHSSRHWCHNIIENSRVSQIIIALIIVNAIILGIETSRNLSPGLRSLLTAIDTAILAVFVVEILFKLYAQGLRFFRDPWNWFDSIVVGIALVPATGGLSVLRALRILRVLRIVSVVPRMRRIVSALLTSLPGLGTVMALLAMVFYIAAVIATNLFSDEFPQWFGTLGASIYTLFQIMTLESWSMGIVRPVMEQFPYAWAFFVPFILVATFTMLNLFIAVVVNAMQSHYHEDEAAAAEAAHDERRLMLEELKTLRTEVQALNDRLSGGQRDEK